VWALKQSKDLSEFVFVPAFRDLEKCTCDFAGMAVDKHSFGLGTVPGLSMSRLIDVAFELSRPVVPKTIRLRFNVT
jgi:hypothetical protein